MAALRCHVDGLKGAGTDSARHRLLQLLAREFVLAGGSFCATDFSGTGELANTKVHVSLGVT